MSNQPDVVLMDIDLEGGREGSRSLDGFARYARHLSSSSADASATPSNASTNAETARNADERQRLLSLADTWLGLAAELENMEALLDALREMKTDEAQAEEPDHLEPP
jgi:hypothetical protein